MGDWEDLCESRGWANDEHALDKLLKSLASADKAGEEYKLRDAGYNTVNEWNEKFRRVRKGEKGTYLPHLKIMVFCESQTVESKFTSQDKFLTNKRHFSTFEEAKVWAKSNPGKVISRSPTGEGYIEK
ncbi:TPA: hypothetical protein ACSP13_002826 [Aeromonas veronii]|uniref:hypothetical protein n=1 Tax=Aeromonas veronii TaxID=654 RepID=UPI003D1D5F96